MSVTLTSKALLPSSFFLNEAEEEEKNEQTKAEDELKEVSILRFKRIFQRRNDEDEQGSKEEAKNEPKLSNENFASPPFGFKKIFQRSKEQKINETIFLNEN